MRHLAKRNNVEESARRPLLRAAAATCAFVLAVLSGRAVRADPPVMVELKTEESVHRGRVVTHTKSRCILIDETGRMTEVRLSDVTSFRKLEERFRPISLAEMRDRLVREFGKEYQVRATGRYLVVAAPGKAKTYSAALDDVYRSFCRYFSIRGFKVPQPKFPLVAVVFTDGKSFSEQCRKDGVMNSFGLAGYYLTTNNRIALFDRSGTFGASFERNENDAAIAGVEQVTRRRWHARIQGDLYSTLVHEATHQIAYNAGLHSRIGRDPVWVVEGLATVFEADGIRGANNARGHGAIQRINRERYAHFTQYVADRRPPNQLAKFLGSDLMYRTAPLDAYAEGWALTFFLNETRPMQYARYLKKVAARDLIEEYTKAERLEDFCSVFGEDIEQLEAEFLRYFERLE